MTINSNMYLQTLGKIKLKTIEGILRLYPGLSILLLIYILLW